MESAPDPATSPLAEGPAGSSPVEVEEVAVGGGAAVPFDQSEADELNCPRKWMTCPRCVASACKRSWSCNSRKMRWEDPSRRCWRSESELVTPELKRSAADAASPRALDISDRGGESPWSSASKDQIRKNQIVWQIRHTNDWWGSALCERSDYVRG